MQRDMGPSEFRHSMGWRILSWCAVRPVQKLRVTGLTNQPVFWAAVADAGPMPPMFRSFSSREEDLDHPWASKAPVAHQAARRGRPRVAAGAGEGSPPPQTRNSAVPKAIPDYVAGEAYAVLGRLAIIP